ncbi:hypothetical protein A4D02_13545 [Niastella koreensis]|uniref:Uncharacterized protein n=1 Tax=Niastella koreensis TaxID=354356 RepID=A0ABX3NQ55_9BACT|nr:hypothetical protein A4D02_13545 [Niastella koreensis]
MPGTSAYIAFCWAATDLKYKIIDTLVLDHHQQIPATDPGMARPVKTAAGAPIAPGMAAPAASASKTY